MLTTITVDTISQINQVCVERMGHPSFKDEISNEKVGELIRRFDLPVVQEWKEIDEDLYQISFEC